MKYIESRTNPLIKETAKLKDRKYRDEKGLFLFEGIKLTKDFLSAGLLPETVFMTQKCLDDYPDIAKKVPVVAVSDPVCEKLSENSSPEGIICVAKKSDIAHEYGNSICGPSLSPRLILSDIRDPGNLGTIIRTAYSFGCGSVILSENCADVFNQKTVRASMGALFKTTVLFSDDTVSAIKALQNDGRKVYATALHHDSVFIGEIQDRKNACFILGNEGHGLSDDVINACDGTVLIPMIDGAESLNVSSAATVILWESFADKDRRTENK